MRKISSFDYIKTYINIKDEANNYIDKVYVYKFYHHYNTNYIAFITELNPDQIFNEQYKGKQALIACRSLEEMDQWMQVHSC